MSIESVPRAKESWGTSHTTLGCELGHAESSDAKVPFEMAVGQKLAPKLELLVALDPPAQKVSLFGGLVENTFISQKVEV